MYVHTYEIHQIIIHRWILYICIIHMRIYMHKQNYEKNNERTKRKRSNTDGDVEAEEGNVWNGPAVRARGTFRQRRICDVTAAAAGTAEWAVSWLRARTVMLRLFLSAGHCGATSDVWRAYHVLSRASGRRVYVPYTEFDPRKLVVTRICRYGTKEQRTASFYRILWCK